MSARNKKKDLDMNKKTYRGPSFNKRLCKKKRPLRIGKTNMHTVAEALTATKALNDTLLKIKQSQQSRATEFTLSSTEGTIISSKKRWMKAYRIIKLKKQRQKVRFLIDPAIEYSDISECPIDLDECTVDESTLFFTDRQTGQLRSFCTRERCLWRFVDSDLWQGEIRITDGTLAQNLCEFLNRLQFDNKVEIFRTTDYIATNEPLRRFHARAETRMRTPVQYKIRKHPKEVVNCHRMTIEYYCPLSSPYPTPLSSTERLQLIEKNFFLSSRGKLEYEKYQHELYASVNKRRQSLTASKLPQVASQRGDSKNERRLSTIAPESFHHESRRRESRRLSGFPLEPQQNESQRRESKFDRNLSSVALEGTQYESRWRASKNDRKLSSVNLELHENASRRKKNNPIRRFSSIALGQHEQNKKNDKNCRKSSSLSIEVGKDRTHSNEIKITISQDSKEKNRKNGNMTDSSDSAVKPINKSGLNMTGSKQGLESLNNVFSRLSVRDMADAIQNQSKQLDTENDMKETNFQGNKDQENIDSKIFAIDETNNVNQSPNLMDKDSREKSEIKMKREVSFIDNDVSDIRIYSDAQQDLSMMIHPSVNMETTDSDFNDSHFGVRIYNSMAISNPTPCTSRPISTIRNDFSYISAGCKEDGFFAPRVSDRFYSDCHNLVKRYEIVRESITNNINWLTMSEFVIRRKEKN